MKKESLKNLLLNIIEDIETVDGVKAATKTDYNLQIISDDNEFGYLTDWLKDYFNENYPKINIEDIFDFNSWESSNIGNFETISLQTIDIRFDAVTD